MSYRFAVLSPLLLTLLACASEPEGASPGVVAGTGGGGNGGAPPVIPSGGQAGSSNMAGAVSLGGSAAGAGGNGGAGAGSGGGGAGGSMPGCIQAGPPGKTGTQCEPGVEGDGTFDQEEPDMNRPPEAEANPTGELSASKSLNSQVYGYDFSYRTYKPTAYQAGKPAALMIFQDGGNYTNNFRAPQVFDALIAEGSVPVTISVYINPADNRSVEYDTRSDKYGKMITMELVPELLKTFELVEDPNGWAIGGHSSGGACAFNVAWWFTDKFRKVMTHSGSFVGLQDPGCDEYIDIVKMETKKPIRVTLQSGTNDLGGDTWFNANNDMAESLTEAMYHYRYLKSTTDHGPSKFHIVDFPPALRWLWRGYTLPHYAK